MRPAPGERESYSFRISTSRTPWQDRVIQRMETSPFSPSSAAKVCAEILVFIFSLHLRHFTQQLHGRAIRTSIPRVQTKRFDLNSMIKLSAVIRLLINHFHFFDMCERCWYSVRGVGKNKSTYAAISGFAMLMPRSASVAHTKYERECFGELDGSEEMLCIVVSDEIPTAHIVMPGAAHRPTRI